MQSKRFLKSLNLKIIFINSFILFLLLSLIELTLGKYFRVHSSVSEIPFLYYGKDFSWKLDGLYERDKEKGDLIRYKRDLDGYRSFSRNKNKKIILTIGGSTTDQTFISEGETWQDYLDKFYSEYDFVNGGVDGLSSYGHLFSMQKWYPETLKGFKVSKIIFYIGINDQNIMIGGFKNNNFFKDTKKQKFIRYLRARSYFLNKAYFIKRSWNSRKYFNNKNNDIGEYVSDIIGHKKRTRDLVQEGIISEFTFANNLFAKKYRNLIEELLVTSLKKFPNSEIIIVQQQIPGCEFINEFKVVNKYPYFNERYHEHLNNKQLNVCELFGQTQLEISEAVKPFLLVNSKVKILPMYLEEILDQNDVYDNIHTNPNGNLKIADYLRNNIK